MASKWYWEDQFSKALPRYLARWYTSTYINIIEIELGKRKISDMLNFTKGYYSTGKIGAYIMSNIGIKIGKKNYPIYVHLCDTLSKSKDPIVQDIFLKLRLGNVKTIKPVLPYGINPLLYESLSLELGKVVQNTDWWMNSIDEIRKLAYRARIINQVMES